MQRTRCVLPEASTRDSEALETRPKNIPAYHPNRRISFHRCRCATVGPVPELLRGPTTSAPIMPGARSRVSPAWRRFCSRHCRNRKTGPARSTSLRSSINTQRRSQTVPMDQVRRSHPCFHRTLYRSRQQFFDTTMKPFGRSTGCATRTIITPSSRLHITVVSAAL
jgi:hypothetical protein